MSAAVGVWKRTNGTLTDVLTIPDASGVLAVVDCWDAAKVAITVSSNNNPVFFMLPPTSNCSGAAPAISLGRQGLQPKSNKRLATGQVYEGVCTSCSQIVFSEQFGNPYVASALTAL